MKKEKKEMVEKKRSGGSRAKCQYIASCPHLPFYFVVLLVLSAKIYPALGTLLAWESVDCSSFYGSETTEAGPLIAKVCWDHFPFKGDTSRIIEWPPKVRAPTSRLMAAVEALTPRGDCLSYHQKRLKKMVSSSSKAIDFEYQAPQGAHLLASPNPITWPDTQAAYLVIDQTMRAIYVGNLKVASSTITQMILASALNPKRKGEPGWVRSSVLKNCLSAGDPSTGKGFLARMVSNECGPGCMENITCGGAKGPPWAKSAEFHRYRAPLPHVSIFITSREHLVMPLTHRPFSSTDLPDIIHDRYFVFSFVRDPFSRAVASYHEVGKNGMFGSFAGHLRGDGPFSRNVHYSSQSYQLLSSATRSGRRLRLDFVGHVESFEEDWKALQAAMAPGAIRKSPAERRALIQSSAAGQTRRPAGLLHLRPGDAHNHSIQPGTKALHFTEEQELQVCRRYLQDFACFGYEAPAACAERASEVY